MISKITLTFPLYPAYVDPNNFLIQVEIMKSVSDQGADLHAGLR